MSCGDVGRGEREGGCVGRGLGGWEDFDWAEFLVSGGTEEAEYPAVVGLAGGGFVVAWQVPMKNAEGNGCEVAGGMEAGGRVYARVYRADGTAVGEAVALEDAFVGVSEGVRLASLAEGTWVATWANHGELISTPGCAPFWMSSFEEAWWAEKGTGPPLWDAGGGVLGRAFNVVGEPTSEVILLNGTYGDSQMFPNIAAGLDSNKAVAGWWTKSAEDSIWRLEVLQLGSSLGLGGAEDAVVSGVEELNGWVLPVALDTVGEGVIGVAWSQPSDSAEAVATCDGAALNATGECILVSRIDLNAGATFGPFIISCDAQEKSRVWLRHTYNNNFIVSWAEQVPGKQDWVSYADIVSIDALACSIEQIANLNGLPNSYIDDFVQIGNGVVLAVWESSGEYPAGHGDQFDIYIGKISQDSDAVGGQHRINRVVAGDQSDVSAAPTSDGGAVLVWRSSGSYQGKDGIFAIRVNSCGYPLR